MKTPVLIIEHCEPIFSKWLELEYMHATQIWEYETIFTNVKDDNARKKLKKIGKVYEKSVIDLYKSKKCIVLDPLAQKEICTSDFNDIDAIIVGGILGDSPPQGRTYKLITARSNFAARNLGRKQLTIDSAVFVAKAVMLGMRISEIEIASEVEIKHSENHSTILPFGYPIIGSKVLITPGLIEYLKSKRHNI
jgi:ribosome biogenesis SPOUT family RNA methylase Rps3